MIITGSVPITVELLVGYSLTFREF